jgi:hypothetical protein
MNPAYAAQAFFGTPSGAELPPGMANPGALRKGLLNLSQDWKTMDPGAAAQAVQGSAFPERYNENRARAQALLNLYWDSSPSLTLPVTLTGEGLVGPEGADNFCLGVGGQAGILQKIKEFSWPDYCRRDSRDCPGYASPTTKKPEYELAVQRALGSSGYAGDKCLDDDDPANNGGGVDCGGFVTIVMRESGADPAYNTGPEGNTTQQIAYLRRAEAQGKYSRVTDKARLQPGDIAIRADGDPFPGEGGHTFFFVGTVMGPDWRGGQSASASQCERAPMASGTDTFELYEWYHLNSPGGGAGSGGPNLVL